MKYVKYNIGNGSKKCIYGEIIQSFKGKGIIADFHRVRFRNSDGVLPNFSRYEDIIDIFDVDVEHISEEEYLTGIILNE